MPELHERLPGLSEPPPASPETARFRLFDALSGFLRRASEDQPLLLVLEDLHAADTPSLLLLQFVVGEAGGSRMLVLATFRDVEVTKQARRLMRDGAQVVKVAATGGVSTPADGPDDVGLSPAELRAVVEAAAGRGRRVAAHAIGTKGIANAVEAGVHSIEHGCGLTAELADRMAGQGAFLVPTLTVLNELGDPAVMGQQAYQKSVRWRAAASEAVAIAVKAGVRIATGTDAGLGIRHGQNLIELTHLVDAGLSPMAAIVAGTATAAEVCGLDDQIGTLEPGKRADLVVAAGNPLDDIGLLAGAGNITLVVQDGRIRKHPGKD